MVRLQNDIGYIDISGDVLTTLTGDAATKCFGVKGMTIRSVTDGLVHLLKRDFMGKGVRIIYNNDNTISIELRIGVDQGVNIPVVCESIKENVRYMVTKNTGIEIKQIDVFVDTMLLG